MLKLEEGGVWRKRFICTVPHTYLYYFESHSSENPRGVIDLDFLIDISREDNNVLKLSTGMDTDNNDNNR